MTEACGYGSRIALAAARLSGTTLNLFFQIQCSNSAAVIASQRVRAKRGP